MRTFTLLSLALTLGAIAANAQTVATFDDLVLSKADTYYVNYSASGSDVGFNDGLAHFPCVYDTSGGYVVWSYFAYSNMTDSITSGFGNQYAAKTGIGYDTSHNYAVASCLNPLTYADNAILYLDSSAIGKAVSGFYVTNSTYAYNAMRDGGVINYPARKFHSGDWFLLTIKGVKDSVLTKDSVNFYLADFRFSDTDSNYILNTWQWVNLLPLGHVDTLLFTLTSSDTGVYGMNTPSYFCMDNFTTDETSASVKNITAPIAKVYPNPATNMLYVDVADNSIKEITVTDILGKVINTFTVSNAQVQINTATLPAGEYFLKLLGNDKSATVRFIKE